MDKQNIVIANWKMNLSPADSLKLAEAIIAKLGEIKPLKAQIVLCPDFLSLSGVAQKITGQPIMLGAQDCFWEPVGAFTGEVSAQFLHELGCAYVILGHSERRQYVAETNEQINLKVKAALANSLIPIICVGETFAERQEGDKDSVISQQVSNALTGIRLLDQDKVIIAYEPVWVIGSGQAVAPEEAEHAHRVIRQVLIDHFSMNAVNGQIKIIYGGSVKPNNVGNFLIQPAIDGILVGGASLEAESFAELVKQANL
ncbi:MAG: triose-phosphate isomerase [Candidatus Komeilibacteria bacterium]|nr:triose-phosphate isomerase [Candidatus Komeilibacteria bacterium]